MKERKSRNPRGQKSPVSGEKPDVLPDFFEHLTLRPDKERLRIKNGQLFYLPGQLPDLSNLRVLRAGALLGTIKNGRFEPSQALALLLKKEQFDEVISFPKNDPQVLRYLRGETLFVDESMKNGWVLICVDEYPLGFAKVIDGMLKNKYAPSWRMK